MSKLKGIIIKTYQQLKKWFSENNIEKVALDTELVDKNWLTMKLAGISLCNGKAACYIDMFENKEFADILGGLNKAFWNQIKLLIMHNAPFDLMVLKHWAIDDSITRDIYCTMTCQHLLDENNPKSLKWLAKNVLNYNGKILEWKDAIVNGFHNDLFYNYAIQDVIWTWQLYKKQTSQLKQEGLVDLWYNIERPFQFCLRDMTINGILVDKKKLTELQLKSQKYLNDLMIELCETAGIDYHWENNLFNNTFNKVIPNVNFNSPKQVFDFITNKLGISLPDNSTKEGSLIIVRKEHPFIDLLLKYREAEKLHNTYLVKLLERIEMDGRIRTTFHNTIAVTGRLASAKPNLQNLPRQTTGPFDVRQCFIPDKGKVLIVADFSGQELRILAHETKDLTLIDTFFKNEDLHQRVADELKIKRIEAKTVNFGLIYGQTPVGLAKSLAITIDEAEKYIDKYFERFPRIKQWINSVKTELRENQYVRLFTGRKRRFPDYWKVDNYEKSKMERQAVNVKIQGTAADMLKAACVNVRKLFLINPAWDAKILLVVHDEIVMEVNEKYKDNAMKEIKETMEKCMNLLVPIKVDIKSGYNYSEAKK